MLVYVDRIDLVDITESALFGCDTVDCKTALGIVDKAEVLASLLD